MIARAESGQARDGMTEFDAAEIAREDTLWTPLIRSLNLKME